MKELVEELEESFRESHKVGNNLILRCVLLRAENQNLVYQIDEKNRSCSSEINHRRFSALNQNKSNISQEEALPYWNELRSCLSEPLTMKKKDEVTALQKTVTDLQNKLQEKEKRIDILCRKYMYLKSNKVQMENDLTSKLASLEKQLELSYNILSEVQGDFEYLTGKNMCQTQNTYEALFLQEKLRCNKLMYEKLRLHHEIQNLEDLLRRQKASRKEFWEVNKSTSEPFKRRF